MKTRLSLSPVPFPLLFLIHTSQPHFSILLILTYHTSLLIFPFLELVMFDVGILLVLIQESDIETTTKELDIHQVFGWTVF